MGIFSYLTNIRTHLIDKLKEHYMSVKPDIEAFIQSFVGQHNRIEQLERQLSDSLETIDRKNHTINELENQLQLLRNDKNLGYEMVRPIFLEFQSGRLSQQEFMHKLTNVLEGYGWNVK